MERIVLITTSYPTSPGDASGHFVRTEARLLALDAHVLVITGGATQRLPEPEPTAAGRRGSLVVRRLDSGNALGWPGIAARVRERPSRLVGFGRWVQRARSLVGSLEGLDRIVAHWAIPSAFPIADVARRPGARATLEIVSHGGDVRALAKMPAPVRHAIMHRLLSNASAWRFVSSSLHDELARALRASDAQRLARIASVSAATIELPDVTARARELREEHRGARLIVLVGRLVASKRFDRALEFIARHEASWCAPSTRPPRIVVVGAGPERTRLAALARQLGLDAHFLGKTPRDEALAWIAASDLLVHSSQTEGLSTVVREAVALGVPVETVP